MKKVFFAIFLLSSILSFSMPDTLYKAAIIGQPGRNQKVCRGLQVGVIGRSDTLQVNGKFQLTAGASNGKVLTSSATGIATWQTPTGGGWGLNGNSGTDDSANYVGTSDSKQLNFGVNGNVVGEFQTNGLMHVKYGDSIIDHEGWRYAYHGTRGERGSSGDISITCAYYADTTNLDIGATLRLGSNINDHLDSICYDLIVVNKTGGRVWNWIQGDSLRQYLAVAGSANSAAFVIDSQNFVYSTGDFDTTVQINVKDKYLKYTDNTQANGYGLVSDANGVAHWGRVPVITSGASAPATTPNKVGDIFVNTSAKKLYFATGTSSSADWTIAN